MNKARYLFAYFAAWLKAVFMLPFTIQAILKNAEQINEAIKDVTTPRNFYDGGRSAIRTTGRNDTP